MGKIHEGIIFEDYDKISDVVITLSSGYVVHFNVSLSRKREDGTRDFFHKEYSYNSKYLDKQKSYSIKRNFDFYLSIDVKESFESSVQIRMKDMMIMQLRTREAINWFGTLFKIKNKKMVIIGEYTPILIPNLSSNKWIKFEPIVIQYDNNQISYKEGIRIYFSSNEVYADVTIDKFMEFTYLISTIDMYGCAVSLLSYLNPSFGDNVTDFNNNISKNPNLLEAEDGGRGYGMIKSNKLKSELEKEEKKKSYFDKMDEL